MGFARLRLAARALRADRMGFARLRLAARALRALAPAGARTSLDGCAADARALRVRARAAT
jgi:hypothetical protein